jgi:hypothetical protein
MIKRLYDRNDTDSTSLRRALYTSVTLTTGPCSEEVEIKLTSSTAWA